VIILTSNIGTGVTEKRGGIGFQATKAEVQMAQHREYLDALKNYFRPEFINRLDEIVVFQSLTDANLRDIVHILLEQLTKRLRTKGYTLTLTPEAEEEIVRIGYDPVYGARPLKRAIQSAILDEVASAVIRGEIAEGSAITVDLADGAFTFHTTQPETIEVPEPVAA
jgi:ATP-dependent Clp protease ATP-binding subunit ClpA